MPINSMSPIKINPGLGGNESSKPNGLGSLGGGKSFKDTLGELSNSALGNNKDVLSGVKSTHNLMFSNHAVDRMRQRGITYGPEMMNKLGDAVESAKSKGAKETLVITDDSALIVSVKNNKVVTVMDKANLRENVFTNIDSTVII